MEMIDIDLGGGWGGAGPAPKSREQLQRERRLKEAKETVLVVDPAGQLVEVHVPKPVNGRPSERGYTVVVIANGEVQIAKWARESGYTLFREWCTDEPDKFKHVRELLVARAQGLPIRMPDPDKLLPRKLLEHRAKLAVGSTDGKAFVVGEGIVDDPEAKARIEAKLRSMGMEPPKPEPETKAGKTKGGG